MDSKKLHLCLVIFILLNSSIFASDNAEITAFTPPTGQLSRGQQAQTSVTIQNTGDTSRSFWVGLSFSNETARGTDWPEGWYDIYPMQTSILASMETQTITFTFPISDALQPGQYYAVTSVWDSFDEENYVMLNRFDNSLWHSENSIWTADPELGATSFILLAYSTLPKELPTQFSDVIDLITEEPVSYLYEQGKKYLLVMPVGGYAGVINGIPISADGAIIFDLADICGATPESSGSSHWVTCWIAGSLGGISLTNDHFGIDDFFSFGIIQHDFNPNEKGVADYRPTTLQFGNLSCPFFTITGLTWDPMNWDVTGPRFVPGGSNGFEITIEKGNLEATSFEIKREILIDTLVTALSTNNINNTYVSASLYCKLVFDLLQSLDSGVFRNGTLDDGDVPLTMGVWQSNLEMAKRYGYDYNANYFAIDVPANTDQLKIIAKNGTGEGSLHTRLNARPDFLNHAGEYTYSSLIPGSITISQPPAGKYYISMTTANSYEDMDLVATTVAAPVINPTSGPNGSISPDTSFSVSVGEVVTFTATPENDYQVDEWIINGSVYDDSGATSISIDIREDTTVLVTFKCTSSNSWIWVGGSESPDTFEMSIVAGRSKTVNIPIWNRSDVSVTINGSLSGNAASWSDFVGSSSFTLMPDASEISQVKISAPEPEDVTPGTYTVNVTYNGIVQPISVTVVVPGGDMTMMLDSGPIWIDGEASVEIYTFDKPYYSEFDISEENNGSYRASTYLSTLSSNDAAGAYNAVVGGIAVENVAASAYDECLLVFLNGYFIGHLEASDHPTSFSLNGVNPEYLNVNHNSNETNELSFAVGRVSNGTPIYGHTDTTVRWRVQDGCKLYVGQTESAWWKDNIDIDSSTWNDIDDGYADRIRIHADVDSVSEEGDVYLYNLKGDQLDSTAIDFGDDEVYWDISKSKINEDDNEFIIRGDPSDEPRVELSNIRLIVTFDNELPDLEIDKTVSSNRVIVGESVTVTVKVENVADQSTTGSNTNLSDTLPAGFTLISGKLNDDLGAIDYEEIETNTYTIRADQVGQYTLPSARVEYETINGDDMVDESAPVQLTVIYGQLSVQADVTAPRLIGKDNISILATVLHPDGTTPVQNASVYALVEREVTSTWQTVYTTPMGWSVDSQMYVGITPMIQDSGNYRVHVTAQKDLYDDGTSATTEFEIIDTEPDITGDGIVNLLDFSLLANKWKDSSCVSSDWCSGADIDHSGAVGIDDILIMAEHWLEINMLLIDDFESGDLSGWGFGGDTPWVISSDEKNGGDYAASSGAIIDGQMAYIYRTLNVPRGYISFARKVSSEYGDDWFVFYIDGVPVDIAGGDSGWKEKRYFVNVNTHTFYWSYQKGSATSEGTDNVWVDDVAFYPQTVNPQICSWAELKAYKILGENMSIAPSDRCYYVPYYETWIIDNLALDEGFSGTFNCPTSGRYELRVKHLTSFSAGCPGDGYAPVTISVNGLTVVSNYDPAENHGGTHGSVTDSWIINANEGTNTFEWKANDLCTNYWIQKIEIILVD